jgi:toxin YoeB
LKRWKAVQIKFDEAAWKDYLYWQDHDRKILKRINTLLKAIQRSPFAGIGKPEPLRHSLSGFWSRHITDEHRLVYQVGDDLVIASCRYHYEE